MGKKDIVRFLGVKQAELSTVEETEAVIVEKLDEYKQKLWQIIDRECDGSRMNDTKWMKMLDRLWGLPLWYRVKFLDWLEPSHWRPGISGGSFSGIPMPYIEGPSSPTIVLAVEWMEINPKSWHGIVKTNQVQEVERRLQSISVPYTWEGEVIRVTGHVRKPLSMMSDQSKTPTPKA